jgi:subtilisin-like proprotein convertase family protein
MKTASTFRKTTLCLGFLALAATAVFGAQNYIFKNPAPITLNDNGTSGSLVATQAVTYPSTITVSDLAGKTITKLNVTLNGFSHTWPDDAEILLVGPTGTNIVLLSDTGGGFDATGLSITFDDSAAGTAPDSAPLASGVYRPSDGAGSPTFPSPAPVASAATALSAFNGTDPNGVWRLYIADDEGGDAGSISGGWSLTMTLAGGTFATQPGELIISEFRLRGPNGTNDEFVEIYNTNDVDHIVNSIDGSEGYALVASDGVARFVITNGTVIPALGHFLGVNSAAYSIGGYPAGSGTTAAGNASYTTDIPDNAGLALFRTATPASFVLSNRLDAVGSTTEANALYKEGSGYLPLVAFNIDYSFYRNLTNGIFSGIPKDTGDNGDDFLFVDSNGTSAGAGQRLGAAGPENLSSPIWLPRGPSLVRTVLDSSAALSAAPNYEKDPTSDPAHNATFGKLFLRRKFTNYSGNNLTRLRFRVVELSTFPAPAGTADLRPMSCTNVVVVVNGTATTVLGATLEQPPSQLNGGGFNSTFSVTNITAATPLTNGTSVNVQFTCGVQQTGKYSLALVPETLPASASHIWIITGNTESNVDVEATTPPTMVSAYRTITPDAKVRFSTVPGRMYQLGRRADVNTGGWTSTDVPYVGTGCLLEATHLNGKNFPSQFYRTYVLP